MNKKVYEKTRYQNIYRHIKNKNYIIMMSKPVKTSIASIDGKKIMKLEDAINIRDNPKIKLQKKAEITYTSNFDELWIKYINWCENDEKMAYNTILRKNRTYNKYLKNKFSKNLSKIKKDELVKFISTQDCSIKQKNQILKELKTFFNWCVNNELLLYSPITGIKKYRVEKTEMKYWLPNEIKKFFNSLEEDIKSSDINLIKNARMIKVITLIGFSLGDRIGETRALTFNCFDEKTGIVKLKHSINYNIKSDNFFSTTKTPQSEREVDITQKLLNEINEYRKFLINYLDYDVSDDSLIFFNYSTNRPYSDVTLRKKFYYYCDKAKVTKIRMYDLRHTYVATMMSEGKELYHISERLGHSNYNTTVNKYGHLSTKTRKEIAEITDKYI